MPEPTVRPTSYRPGKIARLNDDAELQAFVVARLDRLAFHEIDTDVAAQLSPEPPHPQEHHPRLVAEKRKAMRSRTARGLPGKSGIKACETSVSSM